MADLRFLVDFMAVEGEDEFALDRLTRELAADLSSIGDVEWLPADTGSGDKGAAGVRRRRR